MSGAGYRRRMLSRGLPLAVALLAAGLLLLPGAAAAKQKTKWLCKPGLDDNPCRTGLKTSLMTADGERVGLERSPRRTRSPSLDCFYVYPTVSEQPTRNADRSIDPELRSIALYQAARYSQRCRVYAPVYRQVTLAGLNSGGFTPEALEIAYGDVLRAWREFNRRPGAQRRGVVLISHSQGTFMLERLIAEQVDPRRAARRRLLTAILLGGRITAPEGRARGGSFDRVPVCRSPRQIGCVIAFNTFGEPVPDGAIFGRTGAPGEQVVCTNPASLRGGSGRLRSVYPSEPFAPGTAIGIGTTLIGVPAPEVSTPWYEYRGAYAGRCSDEGNANVLRIRGRAGAPELRPIPDPSWGLHLADANIALGDLVRLVRVKAARFERRR